MASIIPYSAQLMKSIPRMYYRENNLTGPNGGIHPT